MTILTPNIIVVDRLLEPLNTYKGNDTYINFDSTCKFGDNIDLLANVYTLEFLICWAKKNLEINQKFKIN